MSHCDQLGFEIARSIVGIYFQLAAELFAHYRLLLKVVLTSEWIRQCRSLTEEKRKSEGGARRSALGSRLPALGLPETDRSRSRWRPWEPPPSWLDFAAQRPWEAHLSSVPARACRPPPLTAELWGQPGRVGWGPGLLGRGRPAWPWLTRRAELPHVTSDRFDPGWCSQMLGAQHMLSELAP